jgi:hypothetical protein
MKRIIGAAVAGVVAFSGIYALAANLTVTSQPVGAGSATISAGCTVDTLQVSYSVLSYVSPNELVADVAVTDTAGTPALTACENLAYQLDVTGSGGTSLAHLTGNLPATFSGGTVIAATALVGGPVSAASITGVSLDIG